MKTLITILLIEEGAGLMNRDSFPEENRLAGIRAMVGYMRYLFDDANGITAQDLSAFTAFFNPDGMGPWTQADRDVYQKGPQTDYEMYEWSIAVDYVETFWDAGPVYHGGHMVTRWWDNTENFGYTEAFRVTILAEQVFLQGKWVDKILFFGY